MGLVAIVRVSVGRNTSCREIVTTVNLKWQVRPGNFQEHQEGRCCSGKEEEQVKLDFSNEGGINYLKDVVFLSQSKANGRF